MTKKTRHDIAAILGAYGHAKLVSGTTEKGGHIYQTKDSNVRDRAERARKA